MPVPQIFDAFNNCISFCIRKQTLKLLLFNIARAIMAVVFKNFKNKSKNVYIAINEIMGKNQN